MNFSCPKAHQTTEEAEVFPVVRLGCHKESPVAVLSQTEKQSRECVCVCMWGGICVCVFSKIQSQLVT